MISNAQFVADSLLYHNVVPINIRTRSVFVTKRAIDYMLNSDCKANGLNCYFGLNKTDRGNQMTLLLTAATSSNTLFTIPDQAFIVFESDILCPDECGSHDTTMNVH